MNSVAKLLFFREICVILEEKNNKIIPIEVKYTNQIESSDLKVINRFIEDTKKYVEIRFKDSDTDSNAYNEELLCNDLPYFD